MTVRTAIGRGVTQESSKSDLVKVDHDPGVGDVLADWSCERQEAREGEHVTPWSWN